MPRKAYVEDLQHAIELFTHPKIAAIRPGLEDGSLTFDYVLPQHEISITTIHALVTGQSSVSTIALGADRGI